jgi:hypothetical protein
MSEAKSDREMVVRGLVVAVSWDSEGNPLRLAILTASEGEYTISPDGLGERLFECVRQEVEARIVGAGEDGEPVALVEFRAIDQHVDDRSRVGPSDAVEIPPPRREKTDGDVEDRDGL